MARDVNTYRVMPWRGGLVTAVDPMLISGTQLSRADNLVFSYADAKVRRDGIDFDWDVPMFSVTHKEAVGTSRTFSGTFNTNLIKVGDLLSITDIESASFTLKYAEVTAISGTEITVTANFSATSPKTEATLVSLSNKVVGGIDFWYGTEYEKLHWVVTVLDNGAVYAANDNDKIRLDDSGIKWGISTTSGIPEANLEVFHNYVVIAVAGKGDNNSYGNVLKYWDGDETHPLKDLPSLTALKVAGKKSAGTTRTLTLSGITAALPLPVAVGDPLVISGIGPHYDGQYTLGTCDYNSPVTTLTYEVAGDPLSEDDGSGGVIDISTTQGIRIGGLAPRAAFIRQHFGRLFANDKESLDSLNYSSSGDIFQWGGWGDSGRLDVGFGDGDSGGISGIAPPLKNVLFVGKRSKIYRVDIANDGDADYAQVSQISSGIGFASHQGTVSVGHDDVYFVSEQGIHSISATDAYGDFNAAFISRDIQKSFVKDFTPQRRPYIKAAYLPTLSSVAFLVSENRPVNNTIYLYNTELKRWYRWPAIESESIIMVQDSDITRAYLGLYNGRLAKTLTGRALDNSDNDTSLTIPMSVETGYILVDGKPETTKGFKRIGLIFKGSGTYTLQVTVTIDKHEPQQLIFRSSDVGFVLGKNYLNGTVALGSTSITTTFAQPIDGYGKSIKVAIKQADQATDLSIEGFFIDYSVKTQAAQESRLSGDDVGA